MPSDSDRSGLTNALPLVCVSCLAIGIEQRLLSDLRCPQCDVVYPRVGSVPILIEDSATREALGGGLQPEDARSSFYQNEDGYLREKCQHGSYDDLESLTDLPQIPGVVLEIGSGSGNFAGVGGEDYCALDLSLSHLRRFVDGKGAVCASAEAIPLDRGSCRFVFSIATLEHVLRPDKAFEEVDRVLAIGGVAYLAPAWHCRSWSAAGLPVRRYRDLTGPERIRKSLIPLRNSLLYRATTQAPKRIARRARYLALRQPTKLSFRPLTANYEVFWMSDSDACASIDSHEGCLFFESRGYQIMRPAHGHVAALTFRAGPLIVRKVSY